MNHQAAIIRLAKERGKTPNKLTSAEYDTFAIEVRTREELVEDLVRWGQSKVNSLIRIGVVPREIREKNLAQCRTNQCGSFTTLADGEETCLRCNCRGKNLVSKAEQVQEKCPAEPPYWDNTTYVPVTIERNAS